MAKKKRRRRRKKEKGIVQQTARMAQIENRINLKNGRNRAVNRTA